MKQLHSLLKVILICQVNLLVQGQTNPNASVDCSIDGLVTINITNVRNPEEWTNNQEEWKIVNSDDNSCKPTEFNDTTATVSYSFNVSVCNTSVEEKRGDIVVTFMIDANVVGTSPTQSYDNSINITCIYHGNGTVTEPFNPLHDVSDDAQDSSELDYNMAVLVDGAPAPSDIPLGTEIEVVIGVDSRFQGTLDLLLQRCYTTYDEDAGEFDLISNSCPINSTELPDTITNYNCTSQTDYTETFFFSAFRYASQPAGANITITCDAYVCLSNNDSSTCQTNCGQCSNTRRRDIGHEFTDIRVRVSAGPYRFVEDENEKKASNEEGQEEPGPSTGLIVGLGVVAVFAAIILCVVVILALRRPQKDIIAASEIAQENPGCECEHIATI